VVIANTGGAAQAKETMTEYILLLILYFTIGAGLIFVGAIIETELKNRRETRQRKLQPPIASKTNHEIIDTPRQPVVTVVRGYDNDDLFREDALIRLRCLEAEIREDLRRTEERGKELSQSKQGK
jgi:hypothetical protein